MASLMALATPLVLVAGAGTGFSGDELLEGLRYRQELVTELAVDYTVENQVHQAGVDVLLQYKSEAAKGLGEKQGSVNVPEVGTHTEILRWITDGERYRFSGFDEVDGARVEAFRIAYDGKLFRSLAPLTQTGEVFGQYSPLHNHPNELGLAPEGTSLVDRLAGKTILAVSQVELEGVPCHLLEAKGPHARNPEASELIRLWIDPRRGFAVLRGEIGGELVRGEQILREMPAYEFVVDELEEISPGLWYPMAGVLRSYISPDTSTLSQVPQGSGVVEWRRELLIEDRIAVQQVRTQLAAGDSIDIDWPAGTQILDQVANKLFVAGGVEGQLQAAAQRIKAGAAFEAMLAAPLEADGKDLDLEAINPDQDCGLRALYLALGVLDRAPRWQALLDAAGNERERGVSLALLEHLARDAGAQTLGLQVSDFAALPKDTPAILFLAGDNLVLDQTHRHGGVGHFLLALKRTEDRLDLYDPLESKQGASVTFEKLRQTWHGEVLLVSNGALAIPGGGDRRRQIAWGLAATMLGLVAVIAFRNRKRSPGAPGTPAAAGMLLACALLGQAGPAVAAAPAIQFEETRVDFGRQWASNGSLHHRFRYANRGTADLVIKMVQTSCDCTTVGESHRNAVLKPGEERELEVRLDVAGRVGRKEAIVAVHSNDPENPVVNLKLLVVVEQDVTVLPNAVKLGEVSAGLPVSTELEVRLVLDERRAEAEVALAKTDLGWLEVSVEPMQLEAWTKDRVKRAPGLRQKAWKLRLAGSPPAKLAHGAFSGHLSVLFEGAGDLEPLSIPIEGSMVSEYFASPSKVLFGLVSSGSDASRTIRIKTTGQRPIEVVGYTTDSRYLRLTAAEKNAADGEYLLSATLLPGHPRGRLEAHVQVDFRGGSSLVVPVSAVID